MVRRDEIRLAWVVGRLNVGGPAMHILAAATALRERGFRSLILAGTPGPDEGDLRGELSARGLEVELVPEMFRALSPARDALAAWRLRAALARFAPHIVQTQTAKAGALGRVAAATLRPRPLVVHTFHGHVFEHYFGAAASRAIALSEHALAHLSDTVVAISPTLAGELLAYGFRAPIPVVPIGIETAIYRQGPGEESDLLRTELGIARGAFVVLSVGRLIEIKRLGILLEAFAALLKIAPYSRSAGVNGTAFGGAHLVLAGDGDRRAALEARARALGLEGVVHFLGWRRDLSRLYAAADAVVLSSRSEGTPVAVMEAMAAGRAVVATRVGGVPDLIDDGRTGLLVAPESPPAITAALASLAADPARRAALGAAARETARVRFDASVTSAALDAFYRGLLAQRGLAERAR